MASCVTKTLWILLFIFTLAQCITAYRLTEELDIQEPGAIDADTAVPIHNDVRSVLWPKICFPALKKRDGQQITSDGRLVRVASRSARKCYPFDK